MTFRRGKRRGIFRIIFSKIEQVKKLGGVLKSSSPKDTSVRTKVFREEEKDR
jgi:hypothetical protein